ncbi:hypothetical protein ACHAXT_002944 [Thalassiosira profunda]
MSIADESPTTTPRDRGMPLNDASANDSFTIDDLRSPSPRQASVSVSFSSAGSCPLDYSAETSFGNFSPVSQDGDENNSSGAPDEADDQGGALPDNADPVDVPAEISQISNSSDCNKRNAKGQSALAISSSNCFLDGMKLLIESGAHVDLQDRHSRTPLHLACENTESALHHDCVKYLLAKDANANVQDTEGRTPLHIAAKEGCAVCINLLLQNGAEADIRDSAGNTPLHITAQLGHLECMEALSPDGGCDDESHSSVESSPSFLFDHESPNAEGSFYQSPRETFTGKGSFRGAEDDPGLQTHNVPNDSGYFTASGSGRGWVKRKYYRNALIEEEQGSAASLSQGSSVTDPDAKDSIVASTQRAMKSDDTPVTKKMLLDGLELILKVIVHLLRALLALTTKRPKPGDSDYKFVEPPGHVAEAMQRIRANNETK